MCDCGVVAAVVLGLGHGHLKGVQVGADHVGSQTRHFIHCLKFFHAFKCPHTILSFYQPSVRIPQKSGDNCVSGGWLRFGQYRQSQCARRGNFLRRNFTKTYLSINSSGFIQHFTSLYLTLMDYKKNATPRLPTKFQLMLKRQNPAQIENDNVFEMSTIYFWQIQTM